MFPVSHFVRMEVKDNTYICEECCFKSDRLKVCCGKKMIEVKYTTKMAFNPCGCD